MKQYKRTNTYYIMEKLKLYNMDMDCEQTDAYNMKIHKTLKEKREQFDNEYQKILKDG